MLEAQSREYDIKEFAKFSSARNWSAWSDAGASSAFDTEIPVLQAWQVGEPVTQYLLIPITSSPSVYRVAEPFERITNTESTAVTMPSAEDQLYHLMRRIKNLPNTQHKEIIVSRLNELNNSAFEDVPIGTGINIESLRCFCDFLFLLNGVRIKYPSITLSPENNIYVCWKMGGNRLFSIHFISTNSIRFVVFSPEKNKPSNVCRISGAASVHQLVTELMEQFKVFEWILE